MDIFTFITSLVDSTAWPIAILLIVYLLRKEFGALLSKIKRVKHNDTEVEFEHKIEVTKTEASSLLPETVNAKSVAEKTSQLAQLSPRGAVLEAWINIEFALNEYAKRHGIEVNKNKPFTIKDLHFHSLDYSNIGKGVISILERLRRIRNEAVHLSDSEIDPQSAIEYVQLANRAIQRIEEA